MLPVAIALQILLFTHLGLGIRYGITLRGDGLEILLLVATIILSVQSLFRVSSERSPWWRKGLYIANCIGILPLFLTTIIMVLGFILNPTPTIGTFETPSGNQITLKQDTGWLGGCSVDPYIIRGITEQHIYREENAALQGDVLCNLGEMQIEAVRWSPDETQLILTIDQEDYRLEVTP
ncbi:MAG: hypothetical protein AAFX78_16520 [Cyanobacteria bacterium J06638_20]